MNQDKIVERIKHKAEELNLDVDVKINEYENINIDIVNICQSEGYINIHTDIIDGLFLINMMYSYKLRDDVFDSERILRNKNIDEIVVILCKTLQAYNYRGINASRGSLIEEFKNNKEFIKYFGLLDKDTSSSFNIDYTKNIENKLSVFKDFVYNLMLDDKVCDHLLFSETKDKKNQSFLLVFDRNKYRKY